MTVRLPDELGREIKRRTDNVSAYVTEALEEKLKRERRQQALDSIASIVGTFEVAPDALDVLHEERRASDRT